eukprot:s1011_g16.t1
MAQALTTREEENARALGGMRNPHLAAERLPAAREQGKAVQSLLVKAQQLWPTLREPAISILRGETPEEFPEEVIGNIRNSLTQKLWECQPRPSRSTRARTPLRSEVIAGWKHDPDSETLASWLEKGAPMGFDDPVTNTGVFPPVPRNAEELEASQISAKTLDGWKNYTSATEENVELQRLIQEYEEKGFCHTVSSIEEAEAELGRKPVLNRLGVLVKEKIEGDRVTKKTRIIWDLRRSGANSCCHQGERVLLPRLLDLAAGALEGYRKGQRCWVAAVDIKDAFLNVPVGKDRFALVAAKPKKEIDDPLHLIIFDTLVFGAASSPTVWGRYAAWLGRTLAAIEPRANAQIYVDDPAFILRGTYEEAVEQLTNALLWLAVTGFPVKIQKAVGGKEIDWVGAHIKLNDDAATIEVSIPKDKVDRLRDTVNKFLKKPVVGSKELRSLAGSLSFVAGLIPHLRPFLSSLWAVLPTCRAPTNDGAHAKGPSGKLVHVRRIEPALRWIGALLTGEAAPLTRELCAFFPELDVTLTTDACPFGMGGTLRVGGDLKEAFAMDLPQSMLQKFNATRGDSKHTTLWEAIALLIACRQWLGKFAGTAKVQCRSDSLSLLQTLLKGRAKSKDLAVVAREFALDLARDRYRLHLLTHIPGVTNLEADALSRESAPVPLELPRSLAGIPRVQVALGKPVTGAKPCRPLNEGFAIPPKQSAGEPFRIAPEAEPPAKEGAEPKPYGRGSSASALAFMSDPGRCSAELVKDASAATVAGPNASRRQLWSDLATKAGHSDPFCLEPSLIYEVMGALKLAGFRSAQQYLEVAKAQHIAQGNPWTDQLQQCYRASVRSCQRHLGSPKQAAPLPLAELAELSGSQAVVPGGPLWPVRATLLASWWLLREIEAANATRAHVEIDIKSLRVSWRLPSSKTDWKALGATRCHSCSCEFAPATQCPYHNMVRHLENISQRPNAPIFPAADGDPATKVGWADTFQHLASILGLPLTYPNGARRYTGHTARATGAVHLASSQVEIWRIQLFGRWGSQVFLQYIKEAPLKQLDKLALETSVHLSIEAARAQLQDLLRRAKSGLATAVACPTVQMIEDCEAATPNQAPPTPADQMIQNRNGGKIHRAMIFGEDTHPRDWKTRCAWHFGGAHTLFDHITSVPDDPSF